MTPCYNVTSIHNSHVPTISTIERNSDFIKNVPFEQINKVIVT